MLDRPPSGRGARAEALRPTPAPAGAALASLDRVRRASPWRGVASPEGLGFREVCEEERHPPRLLSGWKAVRERPFRGDNVERGISRSLTAPGSVSGVTTWSQASVASRRGSALDARDRSFRPSMVGIRQESTTVSTEHKSGFRTGRVRTGDERRSGGDRVAPAVERAMRGPLVRHSARVRAVIAARTRSPSVTLPGVRRGGWAR